MPKMTAKYASALREAKNLGLPKAELISQEALYTDLEANYLMWNSDTKEWIQLENEPADEPTPLVMVRVWSESEKVERAASDVVSAFRKKGYTLIERSRPYLCRPPKQKESRVYLKFLPSGELARME